MWKRKKAEGKWSTPLEGINLSPAQLLMGRRPRNMLPMARQLLALIKYNQEQVRQSL
jgi:hypothetical protein